MDPLPTDAAGALTSTTASITASPTTIEAALPPKPVTVARKHAKRARFRNGLRAIGSVLTDILTVIWICLLYGIPGLFFSPIIGLSFASVAANGAIALLTGNAILRAAHLAHYTTNAPSLSVFYPMPSQRRNGELWWPFSMASSVIVSTLAGTIGCAILQKAHADLTVSMAVLGPGMIFAAPLIMAALLIILSPLLIAMKLGLRWVYVRSSESWNDRGTYRSSYCYSYGTCGDDSDIEEELAQIPQHHRF
ncbi:hypothetical protein BJ912DRAFT_949113 [Pholiota molesta]|nr:hypothetical protein BJ912DRAFT_949113 [Pholiota molesta]